MSEFFFFKNDIYVNQTFCAGEETLLIGIEKPARPCVTPVSNRRIIVLSYVQISELTAAQTANKSHISHHQRDALPVSERLSKDN